MLASVTDPAKMTATITTTTSTPELLWAQRANEVYLTINLSDVTSPTIDLTPTTLNFTGTSSGKNYQVQLEFFKEIDVEESKKVITPRSIFLILSKKEKEIAWWPRLLSTKQKLHFLKTDFSRWKDEDDDDDENGATGAFGNQQDMFAGMNNPFMGADGGMGGFDFSQLAQLQQQQGSPLDQQQFNDSDDEDDEHAH